MTDAPQAQAPEKPPTVAIVGGGMAGMTAALRLAQRGFAVSLYEKKTLLGGNLSSEQVRGVYHDVYPHMFCDWYSNFWILLEQDLGITREARFAPREGAKILKHGSSHFHDLRNITSLSSILSNLRSGVLDVPDMFLLGFSMLDLASHNFNRSAVDQLDVNGFLYSRGYSTEKVARLQDYLLMLIWSIQSDATAAASYQDFIKHMLMFPRKTPFSWLLKGNLQENLVQPLQQALEEAGCKIHLGQAVTSIEVVEGRPKLSLQAKGAGKPKTLAADYVVIAAPGADLGRLVMTGPAGSRISDALPSLAEAQRLQDVAIPVLDLYLTIKVPDLPQEQVAFAESRYDLTMVDVSHLWEGDPNVEGRTVLVVAASNGYAIPALDPGERGHLMIRRLHEYLPKFNPGRHWGDPDSDVDWEKSYFRSNETNRLFLNDVGSWAWRPVASYPEALPNVFFAGDFCQTDVDMACVEAAVQSGLLAAQALQSQDERVTGRQRGAKIVVAEHEVYSETALLAAKLALLPLAYTASAWSAVLDTESGRPGAPPADSYSAATAALLLPLTYTVDWWQTAYWLAKSLAADATGAQRATGEDGAREQSFGVLASGLASALRGPAPDPAAPPGSKLAAAASAFAAQAVRTFGAAVAAGAGAAAQAGEPYKRRWRAKR